MYRLVVVCFISVFLLLTSSCSREDALFSAEETAEVDEKLNKYWDLYDAHLADDLDSALFYMQRVKEVAEEADRPKWLANAYWGIGHVQNMKGLMGEAVFSYLNAAKVFKEMDDLQGMANVYANIGDVYSRVGDDKTAISYLTQAKDVFIYEGSSADKASIYRNLSIHYYKTGRFKEAEDLLSQAEKAALESKNYHWLSLVYNSFGITYFKQNKFTEAKKYYYLTIQYADSLENDGWHKSLAFNNMGEALFHEGKDAEAKEWLNKAIALGQVEQRDPSLVQNSRNLLAQLYIKEKNYHDAIALLEDGLKSFDSEAVNKSINESLVLMNQALLKINHVQEPQYADMNKTLIAYNQKLLEYNSRASSSDEKLENISQQQAIQAAAERYAFNEKLNLAEKRNARMKYVIMIPVILLIAALITAFVAFRRNRHYKRLLGNIEQVLNRSKSLRQFPKN